MKEPDELIGGRYKPAAKIGHGGMGQVWSAYDLQLDRRVAVKRLRADLSVTAGGRSDLRRRFERECRVTARLDHPVLVTVYDAGTQDDELYLVMQLVEGISLSDLIAEEGPLPAPWAAAVAAQLCSALAAVHAAPLVHRDLKPSNVMVRDDGRVVLLDLGIAAVLAPGATRLTQTGEALGSPAYMAPEQALSQAVEPRSDLYALGCMLHEMLSGSAPFSGATALGVLQRHLTDPPVPLRQLTRSVPEPLERLVLDLLAKEPEQRPANAQEVYRRLVPLLPAAERDLGALSAPGARHDPTRPYRFPYAPQAAPAPAPVPGAVPVPAPSAPSSAHAVRPPSTGTGSVDVAGSVDEASRLVGAGRFTEAVDILGGALASVAAARGEHAPLVRMLRKQYARTLMMDHQYRRALPEFRSLVQAFTADRGPGDREVLEFRHQAAVCMEQSGDGPAALAEYRELLPLVERSPQPGTARAFELRDRIGRLLLGLGDLRTGGQVLARLLTDKERLLGPHHPDIVELRTTLDWLHRMQARPPAPDPRPPHSPAGPPFGAGGPAAPGGYGPMPSGGYGPASPGGYGPPPPRW